MCFLIIKNEINFDQKYFRTFREAKFGIIFVTE